MWTLLYGKASTLTSIMGGVNRSNIGIVMQVTLYTKISPTPYVVPVDPGGTAKFPLKATTAQHLQL